MKRIVIISILAILLGVMLFSSPVMATIDGADPRDSDLVYLEIRGDLDETEIVGQGAPTQAYIGIFTGYSLPIWSDPVNLHEELYFSVYVPHRYDEEHDIVIEVVTVLSNAGEKGNTYQLDLAWEKVTPNDEVVPVSFHSDSAQRYNLSDLQYYCYRDYFVVDYDAPASDPIVQDDELNMRLRLGQVGGQYTDLDGELIILHFGILFPRGDLLGDPEGGIITIVDEWLEEQMEEIGIQFGVFNDILEGWSAYFLIVVGLMFIIGLSFLAFWRFNALLFMLLAGASLMFGFYWYDAFTTNLGLTLGLMMVAYALVCLALAFRCIFWRDRLSGISLREPSE